MKTILRCFIRDKSGSSVIEYGLAAALISIVIIGAVGIVGTNLNGVYVAVGTALGVG
jgi:pilus assembly protein Flp/PilA